MLFDRVSCHGGVPTNVFTESQHSWRAMERIAIDHCSLIRSSTSQHPTNGTQWWRNFPSLHDLHSSFEILCILHHPSSFDVVGDRIKIFLDVIDFRTKRTGQR